MTAAEVAGRQVIRFAAEHRVATVGSGGLVLGGVVLAAMGLGVGAILVALGVFASGFVDRRLPTLASVALLPSLTAFQGLPVMELGGGTVDFRMLLTLGIMTAVGVWVLVSGIRPDVVGISLLAFVAILVVLAPLNDVAPLKSLAPIARWTAFAAVYLAAGRWLSDARSFGLITGAIILGMILPAASGLLQLARGDVVSSTGYRITGVYGSSPTGLALAMQLGALALAASPAPRTWPSHPRQWVSLVLLGVFGVVLLETAARLPLASFMAGLVAIYLFLRQPIAIPAVLAVAIVAVLTQPELVTRIGALLAQPSDGLAGTTDPSLRFRLILWDTMLPVWLESPVVGHGTGSFSALFAERSGLERIAPHNDYLGILVENGAVGLVAYLGLQLAVVFLLVRRAIGPAGVGRVVAVTALVEFTALSIANAINNAMLFFDLQVAVWALVGSALATLSRENERRTVQESA